MFFHHRVNYIRKLYQILAQVEGNPTMLVLIPLNCKTVVEQQGSVGVVAVPEEYLIVSFETIGLTSLYDEALVLLGHCRILEVHFWLLLLLGLSPVGLLVNPRIVLLD